MKRFICCLLGLALISFWSCSPDQRTHKADICIYGGSAAGVIAAIQAAKMGKSVMLIEPGNHLGGIAVDGLGGTDINNHADFKNDAAVGGLSLEFYGRMAKRYSRENWEAQKADPAMWRFESSVAEDVYNDWLAEYPSVKIFKGLRLRLDSTGVRKSANSLQGIVMETGELFEATLFIDATMEGDLLHWAGVSTVIGRESNQLYGETKNGIRAENDYRQFAVAADPWTVPGDSTTGVIHTVADEPLGVPGEGDHRLQAYCYRVCLTREEANQVPFAQPAGYDRSQYEIYLRYLRAGGKLYTPNANLPNGKTDLGAWHDLSHNLYGINYGYPGGNYEERETILGYHEHFTRGLFYFLSTDAEVFALDSALQNTWKKWGLCKDEFTDNDNWPRQIYVRDARRMVSDYVITQHHTSRDSAASVNDPVAVAFWPPDVHHVRRIVKNGAAYNEGFVFGGADWRPFGISYRAMVPRRSQATNLLTPTCVSSSHIAYGAIRIEWTYMAMGQAAGTAAVLAIEQSQAVQDVSYEALKQRLIEDGQVLELRSDEWQ